MHALKTALSLPFLELGIDPISIHLLQSGLSHMVDLVSDFANLLLQHMILLPQVVVTLLLIGILLLDRGIRLLVSGELSRGVLEL